MANEIKTLAQKETQNATTQIWRCMLIICGAILMAFNINSFVHAGNLFPGGFTGLAILVQHIGAAFFGLTIPFSPVVLLLNFIPAVVSFKFIGKKFTLYSCIMIILSSVLVDIVPGFAITEDVLLAAIFGGLINSIAIYLCLIAGATSGGTDFVSIFISERYGVDAWNYILIFNGTILCIAGALFGWERALYSIFFQFTSTQMLTLLYKRYQKVTLFVITNNADIVYKTIREASHHDATLFKGKGCYMGTERDMLYSVVAGDNVRTLRKKIKEVDPHAFVNIVQSQSVLGKFYVRPND